MLNEICTELHAVFDQSKNNWTRDEGTREVKSALCRACRNFDADLGISANGVASGLADAREWLYDVSAQYYDDDDGEYLNRSALAAECEWSGERSIRYDFQKLLIARADLRLMVFDGTKSPGYRDIFLKLARYICRCTHTEVGDAWLFAAWTPERFVYHNINALQTQGDLA